MITEMLIDRVARTVGKSPEEVRMLNMYRENDKTHYGQVLDHCQLRPCWDHVRFFRFLGSLRFARTAVAATC